MPKEPKQPSISRYELREQTRPYYGTARKQPTLNQPKPKENSSKTESTQETDTNQVKVVVDPNPELDYGTVVVDGE